MTTTIKQSIDLQDGIAESMGEGVFVLLQHSDKGPQSVVVTMADLQQLMTEA